jgi:hypothetical protein
MLHGFVIHPPFELSRAASGETRTDLMRAESVHVRRGEKA